MTRMNNMLFVVFVALLALLASACSGDSTSPSAPSPLPGPSDPMPGPTPGPEPTPEPEPVSLIGTVRSKDGSPIVGASVKILDGVNVGKTATTDTGGQYKFDGLTVGNGNLAAVATGYQESIAGVYINGENTLDFVLTLGHVDPTGWWDASGTSVASDGRSVSITLELEVSAQEVETSIVRYNIGGCRSTLTDRQNIPILGNTFEREREPRSVFLYTPTVFRGEFVSPTKVSGTITLVSSSGGCPPSATIEWSGHKR